MTIRLTSLFLLALLLSGCAETAQEPPRSAIPAVEAVQARSGAIPLRERVSGTVRAENQVSIRAEIDAPIMEVYVRSGEQVRQGQPLVRLDDRQLQQQLRQAEANVRVTEASAAEAAARVGELETQLARMRRLADQELVSRAEIDALQSQVAVASASASQAAARIDQARATVQERRSELARTVVRAPVSGRVGQRNAEVGMIARSDTLLFEIGDLDDLIVAIPLTQKMLESIRPGHPAIITSPALGGAPIEASLSRISPFLQPGSFSTTGEVDVKNPDGRLTPGMFVTVDILFGESRASTLVPVSAVWENPESGATGVFVATLPQRAEPTAELPDTPAPVALRPVEVLAAGSGIAGVTGVREGEWVIVVGQHLLADREGGSARVRRASWERFVQLQSLQREDLLHNFLEKQQAIARKQGAEPPPSSEYLGGGAVGGS
ncbi:MAG TPA: efflux RND transporter periplasmic adaptor subunit [Thermoanaerobaculia bacterium]|nr:efflux RND transporter periplasmic adaptor subunit [Thermoanaerobaculia bacterium]